VSVTKPSPETLNALRPHVIRIMRNFCVDEGVSYDIAVEGVDHIFGPGEDDDVEQLLLSVKDYVVETAIAWSRDRGYCEAVNNALIALYGPSEDDDNGLYRDADGYDCEGFGRDGYNDEGLDSDDRDRDGFDPAGYNHVTRQTREQWETWVRQEFAELVDGMTPARRALLVEQLRRTSALGES
jgi:hypothetical protein